MIVPNVNGTQGGLSRAAHLLPNKLTTSVKKFLNFPDAAQAWGLGSLQAVAAASFEVSFWS